MALQVSLDTTSGRNEMQRLFTMDMEQWLGYFREVAARVDKKPFAQRQLEVATVIYKDSVVLKVYKRSWATPYKDPLTAESRIFFSVWIADRGLREQKIFYNIHAFKLRKLKGYTIQSRSFATAFREGFRRFEHRWPNVSVQFGPLTLMEGWIAIDIDHFRDDIATLAGNFLEIEQLIDETLALFKR
jgi:hypothetical protein